MGFSTIIDIVGSSIIGGILMIILLQMRETNTQNTYKFGGEVTVQQNLVSVVDMIENDFRKIGYCSDFTQIPIPSKAILAADSTSITFLTDIEPANGIVDTMHYYLGAASALSETPNPRDRMLYRLVNSEIPRTANLGVTYFRLTYFNALGNKINFPILVPGEIVTIQIDVKIENTAAYNQQYSSVFWRQIRLAARNIRNR